VCKKHEPYTLYILKRLLPAGVPDVYQGLIRGGLGIMKKHGFMLKKINTRLFRYHIL
jgi:hypothetical protein